MKTFFFGNGFDQIVEEKDYENPEFVGSWGVSDEDLYTKADQEFERLSKTDKPFFSLVFSSSNHSPYEYPEGKIEPYDAEHMTRNNAVKYSDYAIGTFFDKAKNLLTGTILSSSSLLTMMLEYSVRTWCQ